MKFSEIIGLQDDFQPVFNIENETGDYWKQFIPNDNFYKILDKTLQSVDSTQIKNKLSIWLVGRYGTGKSHASSVIKHILWDDISDITGYLNRITKDELKAKIKAFRRDKRIIPVILKGSGNITDGRTLSLEIERAVKKSLKQYNIDVKTKSDFDRIIEKVNDQFLNWDLIIKDNPNLAMFVLNKEDITKKLKQEDIKCLRIVEKILSKKNIHFSHETISVWLKEISKEIINNGVANGIMIFWDEFTTILEKDTISEIINEIQSIAELSPKDNVYLYLISHRDYNQFGKNVHDILDKVKDRFHNIKYPMVPITTYQILSVALQKKNPEKWEELKNKVFENTKLNGLVDIIAQNIEGVNAKNSIKNLYPIHPYTVYLATFLANNIGSTQRSIFNFIYDAKFGFIKFLESDVKNKTLLTANFLWDFYAEELDNKDEDNRFRQFLEKYNVYKTQIETENPYYLKVFKGVLLLNSLYRITDCSNLETDKMKPHIDNIKNLFIGTDMEDYVDKALGYIEEKAIIQKNPNDLFEISSTILPRQEIDSEETILKNQYNNIAKIIEGDDIKNRLEHFFNEQNGILRKTRVKFFTSDTNLHILKSNLEKYFPPSYFLDFAVFLKLNKDENDTIKDLIGQIIQGEDFKHIVFIDVQEPFGEKRYKQFIEYLARANVFNNHAYNDESTKAKGFTSQILNKWMNSINYIDVYASYSSPDGIPIDVKNLGQYINADVATQIFNKGIDSLKITTATVWQFQAAKKAVEYVLNGNNRNEIEAQLKANYSYIKRIFIDQNSDYIIDNNLNIKDETISHPVIEIYKQVKNKIKEASTKPSFNLAEELIFLTRPPYGLYTNIINMAVLGFAFRDFVDRLYTTSTGVLIDTIKMRDKVNEIFECWQRNKDHDKLNVRLGSEEEKELIKELANIFDIKDHIGLQGIQDIRWVIRAKIKNIGFPIWSIKYNDIQYESNEKIINTINKIIFELSDTEIDSNIIKKLLPKIKNNSFDLQQILKDSNFEKGFIRFIYNKGNGKITASDLSKVIPYIKQKQPEELNWKEDEVIINIKDWIIEKESQLVSPPPNVPSTSILESPSGNTTPPKSEIIEMIRQKIEKIQNLDDFKKKILRLLEDNPNIADILNRYL